MKCIILGVNTKKRWKGKPLSEVVISLAKFEREATNIDRLKPLALREVFKKIQLSFNSAKLKFFKGKEQVTNQEYVDFVNVWIKKRKFNLETSEQRMKRRLEV